MRPVSQKMTDAWHAEDKTGDYRPMIRATLQKVNLQRYGYDTAKAEGGDWDHQRHRKGQFTSIIFGDDSPPIELRNIKSCRWARSVDQDVATCTLVLKNVELTPIGEADQDPDAFDKPGHFTYNRGITYSQKAGGTITDPHPEDNPWDYKQNKGWRNMLIPDRLVKTYEGYGADLSVSPHDDPNLLISGTWLIDKVTYTHTGDITLEMRDVGRMLLTSIVFPPVVPKAEYPLSWSKIRVEQVPARDAKGGKWVVLKGLGKATSSNMEYVGKGLTDPPFKTYVGDNGGVQGHTAGDAMLNNGDENSYWMSTGQSTRDSFVWWEFEFNNPKDLAAIRIDPVQGPYQIYVSIQTSQGWVGRKKIPYEVTTEDIDNGAKIPFVQQVWADRWNFQDVVLKRKYANVKKIRLTFTNLADIRVGAYPWRAMLKDMQVYVGDYYELHFGKGEVAKAVGNYRDYTQIVKWACAWGGFYWPPARTKRDYMQVSEGKDDKRFIRYTTHDPIFPDGRVWGTFQKSHTAGEADLGVDLFDKKPLMDIINYVRDILGFVFFIDEHGGVIWRMPNTWEPGNYLSPEPDDLETRARRERTDDYVIIDEKTTLIDYSTTLSSENIRERIFVANVTGKIGVVIRGFNPSYEAFRRVAGWTDQHFKNKHETRVMADMIAARQMWDWRRSSITTPGNPAIQIDDQIRVFERTTNETYFQYVLGIESEIDMEAGTWFYNLATHWLGAHRKDSWIIDPYVMDNVTQSYLGLVRGSNKMED